MYTTLNKIKSHDPCAGGWRTLLTALGKTKADDDPVSMAFILQSNGFEDAVWTFKCLAGADREIRLFAVDCARQVQHLMTDPRSLAALDVAERFANGLATSEELDAARDAARAAARAAAWDTARAAARAAAWDTAWDTARAKQEELFLKYFG